MIIHGDIDPFVPTANGVLLHELLGPDVRITIEMQRVLTELPIENAEIMENWPWRMMILFFENVRLLLQFEVISELLLVRG